MKIIINIANSNKSVRFINNKLVKKTKQLKLFDVLNKKSVFELIRNDDGSVSIKSFRNKFISAQPNGLLECNRDKIGIWEKFTLITPEGTNTESNEVVLLKTHHNTYVGMCNENKILHSGNTTPTIRNKLNIKYINESEVHNIKKEFRDKVGKDVVNGFKVTGMAIGAVLVGIIKVAEILVESEDKKTVEIEDKKPIIKKCQICGKYLKEPNSAAHLGSLRHREALLAKGYPQVNQPVIIHINNNSSINPVFNNNPNVVIGNNNQVS